ncbi:uncharacterized protein [Heptranchias perlo]|uniref:uncharacterized protein isoform X2 n=1 Tax=Heptranchias perlo TaxID=212740 RepID=UPI00355AC52C
MSLTSSASLLLERSAERQVALCWEEEEEEEAGRSGCPPTRRCWETGCDGREKRAAEAASDEAGGRAPAPARPQHNFGSDTLHRQEAEEQQIGSTAGLSRVPASHCCSLPRSKTTSTVDGVEATWLQQETRSSRRLEMNCPELTQRYENVWVISGSLTLPTSGTDGKETVTYQVQSGCLNLCMKIFTTSSLYRTSNQCYTPDTSTTFSSYGPTAKNH